MFRQAQRARPDSSAGLDSWRPIELKALPEAAWLPRESIIALCLRCGRWPSHYKNVVSPLLRKYDKKLPDPAAHPPKPLDHRVLSVYSAVYRVEAGAWARLFTDWLISWVPAGSYGGLPGRQCLDAAWDVQAYLEEHIADDQAGAVVSLDYWKFFDSFGYDVVSGMFNAIGFHQPLTNLLINQNKSVQRFFKVHGRLGHPMAQHNGFGQGDPFSV